MRYRLSVRVLEVKRRRHEPGSLTSIIRQHLTVLLSHCNKKLIYGHGRVNGDFATEEGLDVMFLCMTSSAYYTPQRSVGYESIL